MPPPEGVKMYLASFQLSNTSDTRRLGCQGSDILHPYESSGTQRAGGLGGPGLGTSQDLLPLTPHFHDNVRNTSEQLKRSMSQPAGHSSEARAGWGALPDFSVEESRASLGGELLNMVQAQKLGHYDSRRTSILPSTSTTDKTRADSSTIFDASPILSPTSSCSTTYANPDLLAGHDRDAARRLIDMTIILEHTKDLYASVQAQLAKIRDNRADMEQRLVKEKTALAKRQAYLKECRAAAEREGMLALQKITAVHLLLAIAKKRQAKAAAARMAALTDLKSITFVHPVISNESSQEDGGRTVTLWQASNEKISENNAAVPAVGSKYFNLDLCAQQSSPVPTSALASTCSALPTPPDSPESSPDVYFPKSDRPAEGVRDEATHGSTVTSAEQHCPSSDATVEHKILPGTLPLPTVENLAYLPKDSTGASCESPIGPYVRPPMPIEDMQRCIRCLLGKDKSLKTGNHARAFLGLHWSTIVSFDPDILLSRGVSGIKEGSTGMASRLRMMTIIESALSNQNNDAIHADIWERPTFFCESCQQRYPISVDTDKRTMTFEEYAEVRARDAATPATAHVNASANSQHHRESKNPEPQEITPSNPRKKRTRNRLRSLKANLTHTAKSN